MTILFHVIFQICAFVAQWGNQALDLTPSRSRPYIALAIGIAQAVIAWRAHYFNPDGTPASVGYRKMILLILLAGTLPLYACKTPIEVTARDVAASAAGFIAQAQANHKDDCSAHPEKNFPCVVINQAVGAQNLLIDAIQAYCSGTPKPSGKLFRDGGACAPDTTADARPHLQSAIDNLARIIADYKRASGGKP